MKKFILLICIFVFSGELFSQQDAQWIAPFYFEDANGDKDTIYIGYDPAAGPSILDIDEQFEEGWQWIDTSKFNVYILQYPHYDPGPDHIISDSVRKKNVTSGILIAELGFVHGKMPITIKWVDSLFYSNNLPFPDLFPRPNARTDVYWEQSEPDYGDCNMDVAPFVLTDYYNEGFQCLAMDSLFLDGSGYWLPRLAILYMSLHIVPYNHGLSSNQIITGNSIEIYPNPFSEELSISNKNNRVYHFSIYNSIGELLIYNKVLRSNSIENINMKDFSSGYYYLKIYSESKLQNYKLIKIE